jgi:hypothetical protein
VRVGAAVGGGVGAVVRAGVVAAGGVGAGVVAAGGALVGAAVVAAGVSLGGAEVGAIVMRTDAEGETDAEALGDADCDAGSTRAPWLLKKSTPMTTRVRRLPATAARTRSTVRGPRCRGAMILVVSPEGVSSAMGR